LFRNWHLAGVFLASTLAAAAGNAQTFASNDLPDDPASLQSQQQPAPQPQTPPAAPAPANPQAPPQTPAPNQTQPQTTTPSPSAQIPPKPETSADQLRQEEKQRILGVMATFNMTNNKDALPLSPRQKFQLYLKSVSDPWTIGITAFSAGIGQAEDSPPEWQGGAAGYFRRFGAGYADTVDGNLWGNAILTSWWHEDPRYYRMGSGPKVKRFFWAAGSSFWCKRDNGSWGPNYANVIGNIIGGVISNAYYPPSQRGVDATFDHSASVTGYGILGAELIEFWPDIAHHYIEKRREKEARKEAEQEKKQQTAPAPQ
jgi:hypothetical protein